jgi:hypothetical protein
MVTFNYELKNCFPTLAHENTCETDIFIRNGTKFWNWFLLTSAVEEKYKATCLAILNNTN